MSENPIEQSSSGAGAANDAAMRAAAARSAGVAEPVDMPNLKPSAAGAAANADNLDAVLDIPVSISMELGRTRIPIGELLKLSQGSVVELERLAGEPLDVMVNGMLFAHGEVVVVNERFGIRFTDVVSPAERVQKLR